MITPDSLKEVEDEAKRFLNKLNKFKKVVENSSYWKEYKQAPYPCPESASLKRSSLDLTKSLARLRRPRWWNEEKQRWEE